MTMSSVVVTQVHRLAQQAKAKKILTSLTNTCNEDHGVLYATIEHNEDDDNPAHAHAKLVGVNREDKANTSNKDYEPEQSNEKDSEDKEDNDGENDDDHGNDTPETNKLDDDPSVNK